MTAIEVEILRMSPVDTTGCILFSLIVIFCGCRTSEPEYSRELALVCPLADCLARSVTNTCWWMETKSCLAHTGKKGIKYKCVLSHISPFLFLYIFLYIYIYRYRYTHVYICTYIYSSFYEKGLHFRTFLYVLS